MRGVQGWTDPSCSARRRRGRRDDAARRSWRAYLEGANPAGSCLQRAAHSQPTRSPRCRKGTAERLTDGCDVLPRRPHRMTQKGHTLPSDDWSANDRSRAVSGNLSKRHTLPLSAGSGSPFGRRTYISIADAFVTLANISGRGPGCKWMSCHPAQAVRKIAPTPTPGLRATLVQARISGCLRHHATGESVKVDRFRGIIRIRQ